MNSIWLFLLGVAIDLITLATAIQVIQGGQKNLASATDKTQMVVMTWACSIAIIAGIWLKTIDRPGCANAVVWLPAGLVVVFVLAAFIFIGVVRNRP